MRLLRSESGAALVLALMLTMLALVISLALLYSVTSGTKISASQKRYRTALAAAHGGMEVLTREIIPRLFMVEGKDSLEASFREISLKLPQYDCLQQKLSNPTANWSACTPQQVSPDPAQAPDATFRLSGALPQEKGFDLATKIIDSVPGNSDKSGNDLLDPGNPVAGNDGVIHPQHVPGLYSIMVQGVREGGSAREKARLSVLYAY
jgi:hypothetical protein